MDDFLGLFMGSQHRAKVLRVFVLNQSVFTAALAAKRAGTTTRIAQQEIDVLEKWGILKKTKIAITLGGGSGSKRVIAGKQKELAWALNPTFKHFNALSRFVQQVSPMEHKHILTGLRRAGRVSTIVLSGAFVGDISRPADILIAVDPVNEIKLEHAMRALEPRLGREIRYAALTTPEFRYRMTIQDRLLRDTLDFPHLVLLDKTRLL